MDMYRILNIIFRIVRNYSTRLYSLPQVCKQVIEELKAYGYTVTVTDDKHRGYRIIQVDGHHFKVIRWKDWLSYDVLAID